jgi:hypothetical protein
METFSIELTIEEMKLLKRALSCMDNELYDRIQDRKANNLNHGKLKDLSLRCDSLSKKVESTIVEIIYK